MKAQYITATEVAEIMGISRSKSYQIVRQLNKELKAQGYLTVAGKCPIQYFKQKFLGFDTKTLWGVQVCKPVSTASLDTLQFTQYLERIRAFAAAELGIELPDPQDQYWDQFEQQYKDKI